MKYRGQVRIIRVREPKCSSRAEGCRRIPMPRKTLRYKSVRCETFKISLSTCLVDSGLGSFFDFAGDPPGVAGHLGP